MVADHRHVDVAVPEATVASVREVAPPLGPRSPTDLDYTHFERLNRQLDREEERSKTTSARDESTRVSCRHDHQAEIAIYERSNQEKLEMAEGHRLEGNSLFKGGHYAQAAVSYRKALVVFDYSFPEAGDQQRDFDKCKLACHLNMAACKLKLAETASDHEATVKEVLTQARLALELDPNNPKAYFRRGQAQLRLSDYVGAGESFLRADQLTQGKDPLIRAALRDLLVKQKAYETRKRKVFGAMLKEDRPGGGVHLPPLKPSDNEHKVDTFFDESPLSDLTDEADHEARVASASGPWLRDYLPYLISATVVGLIAYIYSFVKGETTT